MPIWEVTEQLQAIHQALAAGCIAQAKRLTRLALTAAETQLAEYEEYTCAHEAGQLAEACFEELPF
jgi:hypothetical protein